MTSLELDKNALKTIMNAFLKQTSEEFEYLESQI